MFLSRVINIVTLNNDQNLRKGMPSYVRYQRRIDHFKFAEKCLMCKKKPYLVKKNKKKKQISL